MAKAKKVGGMTQVIECLPSKHEALSSKPQCGQKKKIKKKKRIL
jgi:signal recognition particle GTPase